MDLQSSWLAIRWSVVHSTRAQFPTFGHRTGISRNIKSTTHRYYTAYALCNKPTFSTHYWSQVCHRTQEDIRDSPWRVRPKNVDCNFDTEFFWYIEVCLNIIIQAVRQFWMPLSNVSQSITEKFVNMGITWGRVSYLPWKYCAVWISPLSGADAPRDKIGFFSERKFGNLSPSEGKSSSWRSMALYALRIFKLREKIVSDPFTTKVSGKWTRWEASSLVLPKSEWEEEVYHLDP